MKGYFIGLVWYLDYGSSIRFPSPCTLFPHLAFADFECFVIGVKHAGGGS